MGEHVEPLRSEVLLEHTAWVRRLAGRSVVAALLLAPAAADERSADLVRRIAPLARIDVGADARLPTEADDADLAAVAASIGDATVVVLGETHMDGACYVAKRRLIRFLHERMGFDVLAWESSFLDLWWLSQRIDRVKSVDELVRMPGVRGFWTDSPFVRDVLADVLATRKTARPLHLLGLDCQIGPFWRESKDALPADFEDSIPRLRRGLRDAKAPVDESERALASLQKTFGSDHAEGFGVTNEEAGRVETALAACTSWLAAGRSALVAAEGELEADFLPELVASMRALAEWARAQNGIGVSTGLSWTTPRDRSMFERLGWIRTRVHPGAKVVVWTGGLHGLLAADEVLQANAPPGFPPVPDAQRGRTLARCCRDALGGAAFVVNFTSFRGITGRADGYHPLAPPAADSLEAALDAAGAPYAWLDLRSLPSDHWLAGPVESMAGFVPRSARVIWRDQVDALLFCRTTFASTFASGTIPREPRAPDPDTATPAAALMALANAELPAPDDEDAEVASVRAALGTLRARAADLHWRELDGVRVGSHRLARDEGAVVLGAVDQPLQIERAAAVVLNQGLVGHSELVTRATPCIVSRASLAGDTLVCGAASVLVEGTISGLLRCRAPVLVVISKELAGRIETHAPCTLVLRGGLGSLGTTAIEIGAPGAVLHLSGFTPRSRLAAIHGAAHVILDESDLPVGRRKLGELDVEVRTTR